MGWSSWGLLRHFWSMDLLKTWYHTQQNNIETTTTPCNSFLFSQMIINYGLYFVEAKRGEERSGYLRPWLGCCGGGVRWQKPCFSLLPFPSARVWTGRCCRGSASGNMRVFSGYLYTAQTFPTTIPIGYFIILLLVQPAGLWSAQHQNFVAQEDVTCIIRKRLLK